MFTKIIVAAALIATSGVALASDVSYDQEQIRNGKVTLVEGALRPSKQTSAKSEAAPAVARECGCQNHHA